MIYVYDIWYIYIYTYLYYRICLVAYLDDSWEFPVRNGTGLCGHDGKDIAFLFVHICSWATGYYPHHDIRSFSSGRCNYIHAYTWIPYTLKLCAIPATCHSNTLDCDIGGAIWSLGVIYFPNWGAFQRFFESSNSWRVALDIRGPGGTGEPQAIAQLQLLRRACYEIQALVETASLPVKNRPFAPKGWPIPTIHFQGVSFRVKNGDIYFLFKQQNIWLWHAMALKFIDVPTIGPTSNPKHDQFMRSLWRANSEPHQCHGQLIAPWGCPLEEHQQAFRIANIQTYPDGLYQWQLVL